MVRSVRERVNLTADIRAIIDGYPSDNSLLRELLQNSDDAGATQQVFILDNRQHGTQSIIQPNLAESQGPALLSQNDSTFDESNWNAISTTHSSDKVSDVNKIGKYGVGFRSVYHITENPHVLSCNTLLILDPHYRFPDYAGGAEIKISEEGPSFPDQLSAFAPLLSTEHTQGGDGFPGTIIRLPLRTPQQARESEIKDSPVAAERIRELLYSFIDEESSNCLLFLRNITSIEIREIEADGREMLISRTQIDNAGSIRHQRAFVRGPHAGFESYYCNITTAARSEDEEIKETTRSWRICQSVLDAEATAQIMCKRLEKESEEDKQDVRERMAKEKLYSHVALAYPLHSSGTSDTAISGRLFTLLPLPISTGLPVHIHGVFALMSNRQSLDVILGKQVSIHSKERLRVQWNFAIFEDFIPSLYAQLLAILVQGGRSGSPSDIWKAWPRILSSSGNDLYWRNLPRLVIQQVLHKSYAIFPRFSQADVHTDDVYVALEDAFIASKDHDKKLLTILDEKLGIAVVLPPDHAMEVLKNTGFQYKQLTPATIAAYMKTHPLDFSPLRPDEKNLVLAYLLYPLAVKSLPNILGLNLFPLLNGDYVALSAPKLNASDSSYILMDGVEQTLFANYAPSRAIPLASLPPSVSKILCRSEAPKYINATRLSADDVEDYLHTRFGKFSAIQGDIRGDSMHEHFEWLVKFWRWMSAWDGSIKDVMKEIKGLYLIPTEDDTLRTIKDGFLDCEGLDKSVKFAFRALGVPFVNSALCSSTASSSPANSGTATATIFQPYKIARPFNDVGFVLESIATTRISGMNKKDSDLIRGYFVDRASKKSVVLTPRQKEIIYALPIYATLVPGQDGEVSTVVGPLRKDRLVYIGERNCPLPLQQGVVYVDCTDLNTRSLVELAATTSSSGRSFSAFGSKIQTPKLAVLGEIDILNLCIPLLNDQPLAILDKLVSRIVPRMPDLSAASREGLRGKNFVPLLGSNPNTRAAPDKIINPKSDLASLYDDAEPEVFPGGPFASSRFLDIMTSHGFFIGELTSAIVSERIDYISRNTSSSKAWSKAKKLLLLLDKKWKSELRDPILHATKEGKAWLPCISTGVGKDADTRDTALVYAAESCRSIYQVPELLFDLVLEKLDGPMSRLRSKELLACLGWDGPLPFSVLRIQFEKALRCRADTETHDDSSYAHRLTALIRHFVDGLAAKRISPNEVTILAEIASDDPWFVNGPGNVVATRHIVLSRDSEFKAELGAFKVVEQSMLKSYAEFLKLMGCSERPSMEVLLTELDALVSMEKKRKVIPQALEILHEIAAQHHTGISSMEQYCDHIRIPDERGVFRPLNDVYFNDLGRTVSDAIGFTSKFPAHEDISRKRAEQLGLSFASSAELGEESSDMDELQMEEKLSQRILNVLQGYDVTYALNEYLANAADAGATEFSVMLDERTFPTSGLLTPDMSKMQIEALNLYNNATFKDRDFRGLCKVGEGGKVGVADTIGRFGLGALSMFHFTDIVTVVSGRDLMFLDPHSRFLPPMRGSRKRNVLRRPLSFFWERYPNVLTPFVGLFGFKAGTSDYSGTIFRLPLTSKMSGKACFDLLTDGYHNLACHALLFTDLTSITAEHRLRFAERHLPLWVAKSKVEFPSSDNSENGMSSRYVHLYPKESEDLEEKWLVTTSTTDIDNVPEVHQGVLRDHRFLPGNNSIRVRLALCLSPLSSSGKAYHLFSSLMLPHVISLPLHLDAQFALASDRRSIRFEPPTASGARNPESAYNAWILSSLVPRLYMFSLAHVTTTDIDSLPKGTRFDHWWPRHSDDAVSLEVIRAFYADLVSTSYPICYLYHRQPIAPKNAIFPLEDNPIITPTMRRLDIENFLELDMDLFNTIKVLQVKLPTLTPTFIRDTLEAKATQFLELFHENTLSFIEVDAFIDLLLAENISLTNLPLLPTEDGLKVFKDSHPATYDSPSIFTRVFSPSRFLHRSVHRRTVKSLQENSKLNIHALDVNGVVSLLQDKIPPSDHCSPIPSWITSFWRCTDLHPFLSDLAKHTAFARLPLFAIQDKNECVSYQYSKAHCLLPDPRHSELAPIMQKLGSLVLREESEQQRLHFLNQLQKISLESFIQHSTTSRPLWDSLSKGEQSKLSVWAQVEFLSLAAISHLSPDSKLLIGVSNLPIWEAVSTTSRESHFEDFNSLSIMLPVRISLAIALPYLRHGYTVAAYNRAIERINNLQEQDTRLRTGSGIMEVVLFPAQLEDSNTVISGFLQFLEALLQTPDLLDRDNRERLRVPDTNLNMKPLKDLYDTTIPVFFSSFRRTQTHRFLHPSLHDIQASHLRDVGLRYTVNATTLLVCAKALHDELEGLGESDDISDQVATAQEIYQQYTDTLPPLIPISQSGSWKQFDNLRFIPRRLVRRGAVAYDVNQYCTIVPRICAPKDLLLPSLESVCWTQRACLEVDPIVELRASDWNFGTPDAEEVVAHLAVLASRVSQDHPKSSSVLSDVRATYEWLNQPDNAKKASEYLQQRKHENLFLNVDDPQTDDWEWRSADVLVAGLHFDGGGLISLRNFLGPFTHLLQAAGASSLADPTYQRPQKKDDELAHMRATFNSMREEGELTDMMLMPLGLTRTAINDEDTRKLRFHRAFMAAAVPHLRSMFSSGMVESRSEELLFEGTIFGAISILEYTYTGDIQVPQPETADNASTLLRDLLELLPIAEQWNMQTLKDLIGTLVALTHKLVTPDTYKMVSAHAERYKLDSLVRFCTEFERRNAAILQALST